MTEDFLASPGGQAMLKSIPQRRFAQSADLDGAMLLLASAKASGFMTGATVVVDGGQMWSLA
jgi:NAD(P)-dependent dehydrogenase (short-subunit alcohol dehydrogenase family)